MTGFDREVPDGDYLVKLLFAETFAGVTGPGGRVFSFEVEGKEFKDFDIWEKAGGRDRAYVESVPVQVTDGRIDVTFTRQVENPAVKAVEIIPQGAGAETRRRFASTPGGTLPSRIPRGGSGWRIRASSAAVPIREP